MTPPTARRSGAARPAFLAAVLGLVAGTIGCVQPGEDPLVAKQRRIRQIERENTALQAQVLQLQQRVKERDGQIATLQGFGPDRRDKLFTVERIELGRYTAGRNLDARAGHDGIRVYLLPRDRDGHVIKAAGAVDVQLFDLSKPDNRLIGQCSIATDGLGKHWKSGLGSGHYRIDVPWRSSPGRREVTARVTFTDLLTGRTFTAQKVCTVTLAPSQ